MAHPLVVHCRKMPYDVYGGRGNDPLTGQQGAWGNPYSPHAAPGSALYVPTTAEAVRKHRLMILSSPALIQRLRLLRGKTWGCWCAPADCHCDILACISNGG